MISFLREAIWLNATRARGYAIILAILLAIASCVSAHSVLSGKNHPGALPTGVDFVAFRAAATMAKAGDAARAYQAAPMEAAERAQAYIAGPGYFPVMYPPSFLLLMLPLAVVPFTVAYLVFEAGGAALLAALLARMLPGASLWARMLPVFAFPGILNNVQSGQNGLLSASCFAAGAVWLERRPALGGASLGLLLCKPHLAVPVPIVLVAGRQWRALGGFLTCGLVVALASVAVFGLDPWWAFVAAAGQARRTIELSADNPARMASLFGAARLLGAGIGAAYAAQAALALAAVAVLWRIGRTPRADAAVPAMAAGGLLLSPYLFDYDLACLAVPLAWLLRRGSDEGFLPWEKCVMAAAFLLPVLLRPTAIGASIPLAPPILVAVLALMMRRAR